MEDDLGTDLESFREIPQVAEAIRDCETEVAKIAEISAVGNSETTEAVGSAGNTFLGDGFDTPQLNSGAGDVVGQENPAITTVEASTTQKLEEVAEAYPEQQIDETAINYLVTNASRVGQGLQEISMDDIITGQNR